MNHAANLDTATIVASLRQIMPPTALIDVGIGRGTGAMHRWRGWDVPAAWLVDAESAQLAWTEPLAATHPGWRVHVATLAEADGQAPCYRASNPAESGLVEPGKLAALWPNLREEERAERPVTRLDTLLAGDGDLPDGADWWLLVDCLPAQRVLQGATDTLERCSVLWLRTLLRPLPNHEAGSTLEELRGFLAPLGFRCVQVSEDNHPALGDALFVRDWARQLQPVIAELRERTAQAARQNEDLHQRLAAQEAAAQANAGQRDAQATLASETQAKLDAVVKENTGLAARLAAAETVKLELAGHADTLQKKLDQLTAERDAQAKLAGERAAELSRLAEERDKLGKQQATTVGELERLGNDNKKMAGELDNVGNEHKKAVAELGKLKDEHQKSVAEFDKLSAEHKKAVSELEKIGNERKKTVGELEKITSEHKKALAELDKLGKDHDKSSKDHQAVKSDLQARDATIASLNERIGEQDQRERQLVEEIVRAEAQIELIKDLLLREGGL
ncbi:hypothetical protein [Telluria beijingensis]|uniref:hypothetical protein n=1 Tax=Telluria beijingensis TaxID=3068633 RepID=UPI0027962FD9|nr:hypothetical protein [Massilia sp. REN29]